MTARLLSRPLQVAAPSLEEGAFVLDRSTTVLARGRIEVYGAPRQGTAARLGGRLCGARVSPSPSRSISPSVTENRHLSHLKPSHSTIDIANPPLYNVGRGGRSRVQDHRLCTCLQTTPNLFAAESSTPRRGSANDIPRTVSNRSERQSLMPPTSCACAQRHRAIRSRRCPTLEVF